MAKILVVDDNIDMLDTLEHLLIFYDFEVVRAKNGKEGIDVAEKEQPGLILLDALMPVMTGFEACEKLKNSAKTRDIPIIFLSANYTRPEDQRRGLELGADDYILKPFNAKELINKVNSLLHRKQLIEKLRSDNRDLLQKHSQLDREMEDIKRRTDEPENDQTIDPLTGLFNESYFHRRYEEEYRQSLKSQNNLAIAVLDVDLFRKLNEVYGEQTADYVLMKIANVILNNSRSTDIVFRLEKNKFTIILPQTEESKAFYEAERIRSAIHQTQFFDQDFFELKKLSQKRKHALQLVTVSIGVAALEDGDSKEELYKRVQDALVQAKMKGRNTTIRHSETGKA